MYYYGRDKKRRTKKRLKIVLLSFSLIVIAGICYFLFFNKEEPVNVVSVDPLENSLQARKILASSDLTPEEKVLLQRDTVVVNPPSQDTTGVVIAKTEASLEPFVYNAEAANKETAYLVISTAYFYSEPHEQTQRKSYINHWNNSYASIKPLEEKNGFIYVVFKNHRGQTTKGWLRKKDLEKVTPKYENIKE